MPQYRFRGELPAAVRSDGGSAMLFEYEGDDGRFYITARKPDERGSEVVLLCAGTLKNFHRAKHQGFFQDADSAADLVMRRLLRTGAVEVIDVEGTPDEAPLPVAEDLDEDAAQKQLILVA